MPSVSEVVTPGYCHCGCGEKTRLATQTRRGLIKGEPLRFIRGHANIFRKGEIRRKHPIPDRFWSKVDVGDQNDCWEWTGSDQGTGYGSFGIAHGHRVIAHRFSYEISVGPIPKGMEVHHLCRNRRCVNPAHLEPVTRAQNMRYYSETITHCVNGHEFNEVNTYRNPKTGKRECRPCDAERHRAARRRRRGSSQISPIT